LKERGQKTRRRLFAPFSFLLTNVEGGEHIRGGSYLLLFHYHYMDSKRGRTLNDSSDVPFPEDKEKMRREIYQTLNRILAEMREIKELMKKKEEKE